MTTPTREEIQTNIWAQRLVLAVLTKYEDGDHQAVVDAVEKIYGEITYEDMGGIMGVLAAWVAQELEARQPVNALRNVAQSLAANIDLLSDEGAPHQ